MFRVFYILPIIIRNICFVLKLEPFSAVINVQGNLGVRGHVRV